jgi:hypothetical protein
LIGYISPDGFEANNLDEKSFGAQMRFDDMMTSAPRRWILPSSRRESHGKH